MKNQLPQLTEKAKESPEIKRFGSLLPNDKSTKVQKSRGDQWALSIDSQRIHGRNKLLKHIPPVYNMCVLFDGLHFPHGMNICNDRYFGDEMRVNQFLQFGPP